MGFFNRLSTSNLNYLGYVAGYLFLFMPLFPQSADKAKCLDAFWLRGIRGGRKRQFFSQKWWQNARSLSLAQGPFNLLLFGGSWQSALIGIKITDLFLSTWSPLPWDDHRLVVRVIAGIYPSTPTFSLKHSLSIYRSLARSQLACPESSESSREELCLR